MKRVAMVPACRALAMLGLLAVAGCKTQLSSGLSERDANEEVALLLRSGIPASRDADVKTQTLTVSVEQSRFADAVDVLRAHGLPHQHYDSITDVFKGGGLVASPTEERARMIYALGQELSRTVSEIDGVLSARVQIVLPDNDPLKRDTPPSSASVFIRSTPDARVGELVPQIKMLVANGVSGLSYDKVSVVLAPAAAAAPDIAGAAPQMQDVAGLWVARGEAPLLQVVLVAGGAAIVALAGLAGWLFWCLRGRRRPFGSSLIVR